MPNIYEFITPIAIDKEDNSTCSLDCSYLNYEELECYIVGWKPGIKLKCNDTKLLRCPLCIDLEREDRIAEIVVPLKIEEVEDVLSPIE